MKCRACDHRTTEVMNFGRVALAGAFLKAEAFAGEQKYPLTLRFCEKCLLVQTGEVIPAATMFEHYFYHSSATETMRRHFDAYAREIVFRFAPTTVLEIGCNDGVLLRPLRALGVNAIGVDPAANLNTADLPIACGYWPGAINDSARFDMILANNVFAHIADINEAFAAVAQRLNPDGVFVFEVNRLDELVSGLQYDWIYHEHLYYYSLIALDVLLERNGLEIWDAHPIATHAGSMRYYAGKPGAHPVARRVHEQRAHEQWMGLDRVETYRQFSQRAAFHRAQLRGIVHKFGKVAGYGACGRTNTMLQFCDLTAADVAYIVDDAPAKLGFFTPGTHVEIVGRDRLAGEPPECLIVFAWSFLDEIKPKLAGFEGKVYVPLPIHIYEHKERAAA